MGVLAARRAAASEHQRLQSLADSAHVAAATEVEQAGWAAAAAARSAVAARERPLHWFATSGPALPAVPVAVVSAHAPAYYGQALAPACYGQGLGQGHMGPMLAGPPQRWQCR